MGTAGHTPSPPSQKYHPLQHAPHSTTALHAGQPGRNRLGGSLRGGDLTKYTVWLRKDDGRVIHAYMLRKIIWNHDESCVKREVRVMPSLVNSRASGL